MTIESIINLADAYQLLAIALRYPDEALAQGLEDGSFASDLCACMEALKLDPAGVCEALACAKQDCALHALRTEFTGLFLVPRKEKVFIFESRFLYPADANPKDYSMFVSPCALHAEQCYREAGVQVKKALHEPADHVSTELEFMSHLLRCAAQAMSSGQDESVWMLRARAFDKAHLSRWFADFCTKLEAATQLQAYRAIAAAGRAIAGVGLE